MLSVMETPCVCTALVPINDARCPIPLGSVNNPGSVGSKFACSQLRSTQLPCASVLYTAVGAVPPNSARGALNDEGLSALLAAKTIVPTMCSLEPPGSPPLPSTRAVENMSLYVPAVYVLPVFHSDRRGALFWFKKSRTIDSSADPPAPT